MRNNTITSFLLFLSFLVPAVGYANESLLCKSIQAIQQGDSLMLTMQVELTDIPAKNKSIDIVPALAYENRVYILPKVIINGLQRHKVYARQSASKANSKQEQTPSIYTVKAVSQQGITSVAYRVVVPFQKWMEGAVLKVYNSECECGTWLPGYKSEITDDKDQGASYSASTEYALNIELEKDRVFDAIDPEISYITPNIRSANYRDPVYEFFFDYDSSVTALDESAKSNQITLGKLKDRLEELIAQNAGIDKITIKGYASPDGVFAVNKMIAQKRALLLAESLQKSFNLSTSVFDVESVDEDWDGLERLLNGEEVPFKAEALSIIRNVGVFDGRERGLMELGNGTLYQYMAAYYFPKLRRVEIRLDYTEPQKDLDVLKNQLAAAPESLQPDEMNRLLMQYEAGSKEYKELLALIRRRYPHDETAILNDIACAMTDGNWSKAEELPVKKRTRSRCLAYENNMGVLCLKNGDYAKAEEYFRSASLDGSAIASRNLDKLLKQKRIRKNEISDNH